MNFVEKPEVVPLHLYICCVYVLTYIESKAVSIKVFILYKNLHYGPLVGCHTETDLICIEIITFTFQEIYIVALH